MSNKYIPLIFSFLILVGCSNKKFFEDKILGGKPVTKEELNFGLKVYQANCISCHGEKGDGTGITYRALKVRPRNLTQGIYKFGLSLNAGLPTDEDFALILNKGLNGTAMLPWGLSKEEVSAVIHYIKTFAPQVWEGSNFITPERPKFTRDPFQYVYEAQAVERGKLVYHQTAQCFNCHKAYLSIDEMKIITKDNSLTEKSDVFQVKPQATSYFSGKNKDDLLTNTPPDFTYHQIRSANNVEEIYKRITAGVNGTAMPSWKETLTDDEIWAVAYYVNSLVKSKKL